MKSGTDTHYVAQKCIETWKKNYKDFGLIKAVKPSDNLFLEKNRKEIKHGTAISLNERLRCFAVGNAHDISETLEIQKKNTANVTFIVNMHESVNVSNEKSLVQPILDKFIKKVASTLTFNMTMGVSNVFFPKGKDEKISTPGLKDWAKAAEWFSCCQGVRKCHLEAALSPETIEALCVNGVNIEHITSSPFCGISKWYKDEYIPTCTTGTYIEGTNAAGSIFPYTVEINKTYTQIFGSANVISCSPLAGTLKQGDFITIEGVYEIDWSNGQSTGSLKTFTVLEDVASGAREIPVNPALIPPKSDGTFQNLQTVSALPVSGAAIKPVLPPECQYKRNVIFGYNTFFLAFSPMSLNTHSIETTLIKPVEDDGFFSARVIKQNDTMLRVDILGGSMVLFPENGCIVPYIIS